MKLTKPDQGNWITWKLQMQHLLLTRGLWKYADGSAVLVMDADERTRTEFHEKSQKELSTLVMAISTPQLYLMMSCEQPKEVSFMCLSFIFSLIETLLLVAFAVD